MTKKILYIHPIHTPELLEEMQEYLAQHKGVDTEVDVIGLEKGPQHLEYHYYELLAALELMNIIKQAEKDGYDAAIIGCFYDPFVREAKEICTRMVVTGLAEASMQLASNLGDNFSIISGRQKCTPTFRANTHKYGYADKLASFRHLDLGVADLQADLCVTADRMESAIAQAVKEDQAEVIVLGCSMMFGFYEKMQKKYGVPVIDPMLAGFKHAEYLVEMRDQFGWYTSKVGEYETPPTEEIKAWGLEEAYGLPKVW